MGKSTRLTEKDLETMGLEEYQPGMYRPQSLPSKQEQEAKTKSEADACIANAKNPKTSIEELKAKLLPSTVEDVRPKERGIRQENRDKVFGEWLNNPLPEDKFEGGEVGSNTDQDVLMPMSTTTKEKQKVYVGIDPGKSGAISFVSNDILHKWVIPIEGKDIDASELYRILNDISIQHNPVIILEDVHSLFGMSAASNFSFGFVCGMIRAMVVANSLPFHMVAPKTWQKIMWTNDDKIYKPKKPEQKNPSIDTKATSLKAAKRIFPNFDFTKNSRSKVAHDGIVDAVLLSEYGRRLNL